MAKPGKGRRTAGSAKTPNPRESETLHRGIALQKAGKFREAEFCYQQTLRENPNNPDALNLMGTLAVEANWMGRAIDYFERAVKLKPKEPLYRNNLGNAYNVTSEPDKAVPHLRRAVSAKPNFTEALCNLARAYRLQGKADKAEQLFNRVLSRQPHHALAMTGLARLMSDRGRMDEAVAIYRKVIAHETEYVPALTGLAEAEKFTAETPEHIVINGLLEKSDLRVPDRMTLHYAAGKISNDLEDYADAFAHFSRAKEIAGAEFSIERYRSFVDASITLFVREFFEQRSGWGDMSDAPVFIVGMPRSGTTLIEQILASHPNVHGAGELSLIGDFASQLSMSTRHVEGLALAVNSMTETDAAKWGRDYVAGVRKQARSARRITDKMPHNFQYLGLIAQILPNARIVHCRREPIDTCVSCFTHNFARAHGYNTDLRTLGLYYGEYDRLMRHWTDVLPLPILEMRYEDMISDQEAQSRRLIDFAGLDWDDACLHFHETERSVLTPSRWQVRQPIYTSSVARWKRYEAHLGPLIAALGDLAPAP